MTIFLLCLVHIAQSPIVVQHEPLSYGLWDGDDHANDLVIGDVSRQWPEVNCPIEYVEWLHGSIWDDHALARANLKKAAKRQKRGYAEASRNVCFQHHDWVWRIYPPVSGVNCVIRT